VRKRDTALFDSINAKLMNNQSISDDEERLFMQEMVNSPDLYAYMEQNQEQYSLFVFIPYLYGTTYYGAQVCPRKSVFIPCAHEEPYIHIKLFKKIFEEARGMLFNAKPERDLVNQLFDMQNVLECTPGLGMDTDIVADADAFRNKFNIEQPYVLYAGRKDAGKNIHTLIQYYIEYRKRNDIDIKLVMIGGGDVVIPKEYEKDIIDLGFVDKQDKYNAYAAALCLCQPSAHESFSYVVMESWLCGRPVLVNEQCAVTKNFAVEANGGLYFNSYYEFEGTINYMLQNPEVAATLGYNGREYVVSNFTWEKVMTAYIDFFRRCEE
jgi:glycosyltransferase involved in cell wall biosynthesis